MHHVLGEATPGNTGPLRPPCSVRSQPCLSRKLLPYLYCPSVRNPELYAGHLSGLLGSTAAREMPYSPGRLCELPSFTRM